MKYYAELRSQRRMRDKEKTCEGLRKVAELHRRRPWMKKNECTYNQNDVQWEEDDERAG